MKCPFCGNADTQVKDSRPSDDGAAIRRRRLCGKCEGRFTTFERVQLRELAVIKRNGRRVPFDRDKLMRSIQVALRKRNVDDGATDATVAIVERMNRFEPHMRDACAQQAIEVDRAVEPLEERVHFGAHRRASDCLVVHDLAPVRTADNLHRLSVAAVLADDEVAEV